MSVYFPSDQEFYDAAYAEVPAASAWAAFLDAYYGAGQDVPAEDQPAYLSLDSDEDSPLFTVTVPLDHVAPGAPREESERIRLSITIDQDVGEVTSETYYAESADGLLAEFSPAPDGIVVPLLLTEDGEWVDAPGPGLFADLEGLQYGFDRLPSGTALAVALVVDDFAGNRSELSAEVVVP